MQRAMGKIYEIQLEVVIDGHVLGFKVAVLNSHLVYLAQLDEEALPMINNDIR
jgi:hypothetical protein